MSFYIATLTDWPEWPTDYVETDSGKHSDSSSKEECGDTKKKRMK